MGYVFAEVWPLVVVALAVGALIGWFARVQLVRSQDDAHAAELAARDERIAALEAQAADLGHTEEDLSIARARIVQLEGETALMDDHRARIAALEEEVAHGVAIANHLGEVEPVAARVPGLEAQVAELEEKVAELESFRTRFVSADREAATLRARVAELESEDRLPALQARIGELESAARERDDLRGRAQDLERRLAAAEGTGDARVLRETRQELERLQARHREEVALLAEARARIAELEGGGTPQRALFDAGPAAAEPAPAPAAPAPAPDEGPRLDLHLAARILGVRVRMDDLTMVEGIGPKIGRLCREGGVGTWREMSRTPVERLREILDAAGPNYRMHDPATWPDQAALLADGRWDDFKAFAAELRAGRTAG
ncbi:MAG: hypothetical protein U0237_16780 [Thermoleophilia bacterium]